MIDPALGSLISGIALSVSAIATVSTLFLVSRQQVELTRKQQDADWQKHFRDTYLQFWGNDDLATVRGWISNDNLYMEIQPVLSARLASEKNILSFEDNRLLEKVDRFCAALASIDVLGAYQMSQRQEALYRRVYGSYWPKAVEQREELKAYVNKYWQGHPLMKSVLPVPEVNKSYVARASSFPSTLPEE